VLLGVTQSLGIVNPDIPKMATAFGGGVGRSGALCGALAGATLAIGLVHGRKTPTDPRDPAYQRAHALFLEFQKQMGNTTCLGLTGLDLNNPEEAKKLRETGVHDRVCVPAVRLAARLTEQALKSG
jgi:C_GCAxxG_C_C family probable redox protein